MTVDPVLFKSYFNKQFYSEIPKTIYHYCSTDTFVKIINNSTIRLHNITKSNDVKEVIFIKPLLLDTLDKMRKYFNESKANEESEIKYSSIEKLVNDYFEQSTRIYFAMSFSRNSDKLGQWERYADKGKGIAIGFDSECLCQLQATNSGYIFSRVVYDLDELKKELTLRTNELFDNNRISNVNDFNNYVHLMLHCLTYYAPLYKNEYFKDEEEWRLVFIPTKHFRYLENLSLQEWLKDINQEEYRNESCGFVRQPICYANQNNLIRAYLDIDFEKLKKDLIKEIIIGANSEMSVNDEDLIWMLLQKGYSPSLRNGAKRVKLSKADNSYRGK